MHRVGLQTTNMQEEQEEASRAASVRVQRVLFVALRVVFHFRDAHNDHVAGFTTSTSQRVQPRFGLNTTVV